VLRTLVPSIGEESTVSGANLDARDMTETLIVEAWLSANGKSFAQLTPAAYVGNGVDTGTRTLIRQRMEQAGPTRELFQMVERLIARRTCSPARSTRTSSSCRCSTPPTT